MSAEVNHHMFLTNHDVLRRDLANFADKGFTKELQQGRVCRWLLLTSSLCHTQLCTQILLIICSSVGSYQIALTVKHD